MASGESKTFEEILALLPNCAGPAGAPLTGTRPDVGYAERFSDFVSPTLEYRTELGEPASPRVIVISAPGAVGKSTLASELAARKSAPLWDLAKTKSVGQGSVDGMVTQAFGRGTPASAVYEAIRSGALFLVVDALDEARVKVTESAFEDFLRDLSATANESPSIGVVILGRTQVAETAWLLLDATDVPTAFYTIEPFDDEASFEYVAKRISRIGGPAAASMRQNPGPFIEARDLLFGKLREAVRGARTEADARDDVRAFVGYAPVLDAMAVRLASNPNWVAQRNDIEASLTAGSGPVEFRPAMILRQVIDAVLSREHEQKLLANLRPVLEPTAQALGWSNWPILYNPDEQCARVLARHLGVPTDIGSTLKLPQLLAAQYEEQLASWLPEHPFLRDGHAFANVVFEAYVYARALRGELHQSQSHVETRLSQPAYLPNRLLGEFYLLAGGGDDVPAVDAVHVGWLYDSMLADETRDLRVEFSVDGPDPFDPELADEVHAVDGEFSFVRPSSGDTPTRRIEFRTRVGARSRVVLGRYIKHASIVLPCEVVLGAGGDDFEIGPRVQLSVTKLTINARALSVGGKAKDDDDEGSGVFLEALDCESNVVTRPVIKNALRVSWPGSNVFPWTEFSTEQKAAYAAQAEMAAAYRRFRRIVMTLRSHSKGSLARYRHKVEHQRVLQGSLGEALLQTLIDDGILRRDDSFYHWVPERAQSLVGVDWHQLRRGEVSDKLNAYLQKFVGTLA